jgi:lysophospholipase L1-like esterase
MKLFTVHPNCINQKQPATAVQIVFIFIFVIVSSHANAQTNHTCVEYGCADGSVHYGQSIFQNKLIENGVKCDFITIPGGSYRLAHWNNYLKDYGSQVVVWLHDTLEYRQVIDSNQQPDTIKIMPVGNSITAGEHYKFPPLEERTGYRKPLYEMLIGAGYNVDFVGSQKHGIRSINHEDWYDWNCEAYPGWKIPDIASKLDTALTSYQPDILLIHVGTNGKDWEEKPTQVSEMLDMINEHAIKNDHPMTVFLCLIINRFIEEDAAPTTQYNRDLTELVHARTGDKVQIILVDMEKGADLDYSDNLPDPNANPPYEGGDMLGRRYPGVAHDRYHPNDKGNTKMAMKFYEELVKVLPEPVNTKN